MKTTITVKNIEVPKIGLGTYKLTGPEGIRAMGEAIHLGYRHIDSAQYYENEEEVGIAVRKSGIARDELFITTKVWPTDFKRLIPSVEGSLKKFRMEYADLVLLHWPSDDRSNSVALGFLSEAQEKGYAKNIGVSNFSLVQLEAAIRQVPSLVCNQVQFNPYAGQEEMLRYLEGHHMFLTAYSPLALGKVSVDPVLRSIGARHNKTAGQVALRWLIQQGDVAVIPKSSSPKRLRENMEIADFILDGEDMKAIFALHKTKG